jgi:hypothetical protein
VDFFLKGINFLWNITTTESFKGLVRLAWARTCLSFWLDFLLP